MATTATNDQHPVLLDSVHLRHIKSSRLYYIELCTWQHRNLSGGFPTRGSTWRSCPSSPSGHHDTTMT